MWSTRKELETVLAQAGLGEWSPRLAAAARPAVILEPGPLEEGADAPIGASRLGGMPDLPPDVSWPWRPALSGRTVFADHAERPWPLTFVAQIDFAEVHSAGGLEGAPSSGRLLFFCDPILEPWGWSSDNKSCASVMFFTEETGPSRAAPLSRRIEQSGGRAPSARGPLQSAERHLQAAARDPEAVAAAAAARLRRSGDTRRRAGAAGVDGRLPEGLGR